MNGESDDDVVHLVKKWSSEPPTTAVRCPYAFNLFSLNAPVTENGYNEEEMKLVKETRKIWNDTEVKVTATCIRVPVMRAHAESVNLQFDNPLDETHFDITAKDLGLVDLVSIDRTHGLARGTRCLDRTAV
ncbi:hypothetical protein HID58_034571 [Brassica napus]|uniref:Semialdehyde dehydrogenase dimerisation domain-containing protein n=1 Tax=Brassica napus TaxID=3708 RepID=A0ABQ8C2G6_BRANA|nr:hypothetical protein HID58_034571 [Brassica napus]